MTQRTRRKIDAAVLEEASLNLLRATPEPELRLHHVDRRRFSAIMCRKFADVTAFFWHLPDAHSVKVGVLEAMQT